MAFAIASIQTITNQDANSAIWLAVAYTGTPAELPDGTRMAQVFVELGGAETAANVRTKMSAAIVADAAAQGITVTGGNMLLPSFQKG